MSRTAGNTFHSRFFQTAGLSVFLAGKRNKWPERRQTDTDHPTKTVVVADQTEVARGDLLFSIFAFGYAALRLPESHWQREVVVYARDCLHQRTVTVLRPSRYSVFRRPVFDVPYCASSISRLRQYSKACSTATYARRPCFWRYNDAGRA